MERQITQQIRVQLQMIDDSIKLLSEWSFLLDLNALIRIMYFPREITNRVIIGPGSPTLNYITQLLNQYQKSLLVKRQNDNIALGMREDY